MSNMGKMLIMLGALIALMGVFLVFFEKLPHIGKLPGDIYIKRKNFTFYFPLTTCIIISIIITLILSLFRR